MKQVILNWSGGKDATLCLHYLREMNDTTIVSLLTTMNEKLKRITMHGVHEHVLYAQVEAIREHLDKIYLPEDISMKKYAKIIDQRAITDVQKGITHYAYGDIYLEDLRKFRDQSLEKNGLQPLYPLWKKDTVTLANEFISLGYKAVVVATSSDKLDDSFVGCEYDLSFIDRLPAGVDPCGENGEFHTFVYDGPIFSTPIPIAIGTKTSKTYTPSPDDDDCFCEESKKQSWDTKFWFCELTLQND